MATSRDILLDWLRNAHAMEVPAEDMFKSQARRIEHYPPLRERIERHLIETREQQAMLAQCLKQLGAEPSASSASRRASSSKAPPCAAESGCES